MPQKPTESPAATTLIKRMFSGIQSRLRTIVEWMGRPEAIPAELKDMLTMDQVREAMEIYYADYKRDYHQPTTVSTPLGNIQFSRRISMDSIGDSSRKLDNIFAIFEIRFGVNVQKMDPRQKVAMTFYCMSLIGIPGVGGC